jgi:hypothetical protein
MAKKQTKSASKPRTDILYPDDIERQSPTDEVVTVEFTVAKAEYDVDPAFLEPLQHGNDPAFIRLTNGGNFDAYVTASASTRAPTSKTGSSA